MTLMHEWTLKCRAGHWSRKGTKRETGKLTRWPLEVDWAALGEMLGQHRASRGCPFPVAGKTYTRISAAAFQWLKLQKLLLFSLPGKDDVQHICTHTETRQIHTDTHTYTHAAPSLDISARLDLACNEGKAGAVPLTFLATCVGRK